MVGGVAIMGGGAILLKIYAVLNYKNYNFARTRARARARARTQVSLQSLTRIEFHFKGRTTQVSRARLFLSFSLNFCSL